MGDGFARWRQADTIYKRALELSPEARPGYVNGACGDDAALQAMVERLLGPSEEGNLATGGALQGPLGDRLAEAMGAADSDPTMPRVTRSSLEPGRRIGHYEVTARIGAGGMGIVYQGRDTRLKRDVAIKVLPAHLVESPTAISRFQREAEMLAALNHPGIATIHSIEKVGDERFLVMELVEGRTLAERLTEPLDLGRALEIACRIAEAMEAAHERGIVHRDLKPSNVMLTIKDAIKLLDFGLALPVAIERGIDGSQPIELDRLTESGAIVGTAPYMSPEQIRGETVGKRSDIWAYGCLLFEMITGNRAFDGDTSADVLRPARRARARRAGLPRAPSS